MTDAILQNLKREIDRFQKWENQNPNQWWDDYENWPDIHHAFGRFVQAVPFQRWGSETTKLVLYAIARDHEAEHLAEEVAKNPLLLLFLAQASLTSDECEAKWLLAAQLGELPEYASQSEPVLIRLVEDGRLVKDGQDVNEYPSRRALLALGRLKSSAVEDLVGGVWSTGYEYQRMGALQALSDVASPQLESYLQQAEKDGNEYLRLAAKRIRDAKFNPERPDSNL